MHEFWVFHASTRYYPRIIVHASCEAIVRWAFPNAVRIYKM